MAFFFSSELSALETNVSNFTISGFGTLGLIKSTDKELGFRETISQKGVFDEYDFSHNSDLGIQANYYATDKLEFGLQFLAKKRYNESLDNAIQSAYINYYVTPRINLRLGRVSAGSYMMSDYMHVGFTQLWSHLPTEFYASHPVTAIDGIDLIFKQSLFGGLLRTKLWFGRTNYDIHGEPPIDVNLEQMLGASVAWENNIWSLKLSHSQIKARVKNNTITSLEQTLQAASLNGWPEAANFTDLLSAGSIIRYYSAAVTYGNADWLIQSELGLVNSESILNPSTVSGYLSVGRKLGPITPFIMGGWSKAQNHRFIMPTTSVGAYIPLQQFSQYVFNQNFTAQNTLSVGARWDVQPKIALKIQWDKTWVDEYGNKLLDKLNGAIAEKRQLDTYSITVDFLF
jgi:hypothetical protein